MKIRPVLWLFVSVCVVSSVLRLSTRARAVPGSFKARVVARLPIERNEPVRIRAVKLKAQKSLTGKNSWRRMTGYVG